MSVKWDKKSCNQPKNNKKLSILAKKTTKNDLQQEFYNRSDGCRVIVLSVKKHASATFFLILIFKCEQT